MRKNTWVFYFFIILFTFLLSVNLVWRFTPVKAEIRKSLEERLSKQMGESFELNDFSLGFGYISFYNISAGSREQGILLQIDEVQIGYSLHKLLYHKLDPLKVIETITFKDPHFYFWSKKQKSSENGEKKEFSEILSGFRELAEIDRIFINDGNLIWKRPDKEDAVITSQMDGVLLIGQDMKTAISLKGKLFDSSSEDLELNGTIDFMAKNWQMHAEVDNCILKNGLPFLDGDAFSVKTARLTGQIDFQGSSLKILDLDARGNIAVEDMLAETFDQEIRTNEYNIIFSGQKMELSPVSGEVGDGRFVLAGDLGEIFHPAAFLSIDFDRYSAKDLAISAPILELLNRGKLQGHLNINKPDSGLSITGNIYSSKLNYSIVPFYRSALDFTFTDMVWTFHNIKTTSVGMEHIGTGAIDFNSMTMWLDLDSKRVLEGDVFYVLDRLNNTTMTYQTHMDGDFGTLTFQGKIQGAFATADDSVLTTEAHYVLVEDRIEIKGLNTSPGNLEYFATVSNLWEEPTFDIMELQDVPFDSLSSIPAVGWLSKKLKSNFYFSGPINYPSAKVNFINRESSEKFFSLAGTAVNLIQPDLKFSGNYYFFTSPRTSKGNFSLENNEGKLLLQITSPGILEAGLEIGQGDDAPVSGEVNLEDLNVNQYLGALPGISGAISEGELNGTARIHGTKTHVSIEFDLGAQNFVINQNGYYAASFKGIYNGTDLNFEQAKITHNNHPILSAQFDLNLADNRVDAYFKGEHVESNYIAATIFNDPDMIRGFLNYEVLMKGDFDRPDISGFVNMPEGELQDRIFSSLVINFEDSIPPASDLFEIRDHIFRILNFIYVDNKDYSIEANGLLAVDENGPLEVNLSARGNVLAELPDIIEYFQNPVCLGDLDLHIAGTRESPQLISGKLLIYNGSMEFESVLPPIKNLKADIELRENEQFVRILNLQAEMEEKSARIYNIRSGSVPLEPWYFEDLGLNFGILVLETDPTGIPLSIPGLMEPEDIGYFAVSGKSSDEKFYFAGPIDDPHVRGNVTLYESRVTFPFLVDEDEAAEEDSKVVDFLMNTTWNMKVESGRGNRYFVDIPAIIGEVYLDLNIDNTSPGLEFTGKLNDESFRVEGQVESTRGRVEYLDMNFRVERFGAEFSRFELYPQVYGRAWTTVRTNEDFPKDIYLVLYAVDPETKQEVSRGRWEDFRFKLVTNDPSIRFSPALVIDETQEDALSYMGYSVENLPSKAGDVGLTLTENFLIRPLVRPLERRLERSLKLDYVRLQWKVASNLMYFGFQDRLKFLQNPEYYQVSLNNSMDPALLLFQSSEVTFGKYLIKDTYFTYSGQLVSVYDESKLGLNHTFGIEYRLLRNLLLEFEYDKFQFNPQYYSRDKLNDFRVRLRHSFNF